MARPKTDARAADSASAAASAAPAGGASVAPATPMTPASDKAGAGEGNEAAAAATPSPSPAEAGARVMPEVADARAVADRIVSAATPVVKVVASRACWRARRFWPQGETDLTDAECEQLGEAGFEALRGDPVFTIVPLYAD